MNHGSQDPASGMRHLAQISTAFDEHEVVRRLSEMVTCTADDAYKPESIDDLDIDFEQFGDFRTMAIAQVRAQRARERKDMTLELERRRVQQVIADNRHRKITPELLSKHFLVTTEKAKQMQLVTTQVGLRRGVGPMDRRLRVMGPSPNVPRVQGHWYGDVLFSDVTSITQNNCMMFFSNVKGYKKAYGMPTKSAQNVAEAYDQFRHDVGVPLRLTTDLAPEFVGRNSPFLRAVKADRVKYTQSEKGRSNQNWAAELGIGQVRRKWRRYRTERRIPKRLWDFGMTYAAEVDNFLPSGPNGITVFADVHGYMPDISPYCNFGLHDAVYCLLQHLPC